uniref:Uncharacterized protein n=1 Tax=Rhizophora mucronata TaxID=61149 RepID=A0A2P2JAP9_RHIMU
MKKIYKKGKVHPSPPSIAGQLSLLPVAILTLAAALSPEDKEVLAYLLSCSGTAASDNFTANRRTTHHAGGDDRGRDGEEGGGDGDHGPTFGCYCFSCYLSFWARWDTSPNRQVIHEIIEAYEEGLFQKKRKSEKKKKEKTKRVANESKIDGGERNSLSSSELESVKDDLGELESVEPCSDAGQNQELQAELERDTVRKIVNFIGEKIWGVWNRD